ncbi:MAG: Type 1 glutamine amidotransferase-like domain-containing protein [Candidatus Pacebacteria bacterium]|nr:Type 1 glutamine amidotransferase-like domain-containing protein [Candidatus Paceibacterota bacterium]
MIKIILVGGYTTKAEDGGKALAQEMVAGFAEPVKILDCMFARNKQYWESSLAEDVLFFKNHLPDTKIDVQLARPDSFLEQIAWADVIYFRGGSDALLMDALSLQSGWEKLLDEKTIAGTSAGACALSAYYYELDDDSGLGQGFGLVPVKIVVHYRSNYNAGNIDWDYIDRVMDEHYPNVEKVNLKEGEFKVFSI